MKSTSAKNIICTMGRSIIGQASMLSYDIDHQGRPYGEVVFSKANFNEGRTIDIIVQEENNMIKFKAVQLIKYLNDDIGYGDFPVSININYKFIAREIIE